MADRHLDVSGGPTDSAEAVVHEQERFTAAVLKEREIDARRRQNGDIPLSFLRAVGKYSRERRGRFGGI